MARKKEPPKFTGPLAEPIVVPFVLPDPSNPKMPGFDQRLAKLELLFDHYEVQRGEWHLLALVMAIDTVPGFRIVYDDPLAANLNIGEQLSKKSNRSGHGYLPWFTGDRLLLLTDNLSKLGVKSLESIECLAQFIVDHTWQVPLSRGNLKDREQKARTIARRIRAEQNRRDGPLQRGRSRGV